MYFNLALRQLIALSFIAIALTLSACGSNQTRPELPTVSRAAELSEDAARYEVLAQQSADAAQRAVYQYLAAQAWYQSGYEDRAFFLLVNLNSTLLSPEDRLKRHLTLADFNVTRGKPVLALEYLEDQQIKLDLKLVSSEQRSIWATTTADLSALIGDYKRAIEIYDFALLYADSNELSSLRSSLWRSLTLIDDSPTGPYLSNETSGWVALAEINNQSTGTVSDQYLSYLLWQDQYHDHPARINPPHSFSALAEIAASDRPKVAILLPLTGPLASAGSAILDGYMSARADEYDKKNINPLDPLAPESIKIYDTHALSFVSIVRDLEQENVDLVIGPLDRDRVENYVALMPDIPTLALNRLPEQNDATEYTSIGEKPILGLSLNVEDEAAQAAIKALQEGHQRAMILAPNSSWGDRAGFAFSKFWQNEGAQVIEFQSYDDSTTHADLLGKSLHVTQSETRKNSLQQLLGKSIEFTPRRRQDVDALFLAASPNQARQLKPMLAYFFAEDIPVYSTSSVYSGLPNSKADRDLDGIQFSTLPWVLENLNSLRQDISNKTPSSASSLKMQAIGVDSYYLSQRLTQLLKAPDTLYRGVTGKLSRSAGGNDLHRKQVWAEFSRGLAKPSSSN